MSWISDWNAHADLNILSIVFLCQLRSHQLALHEPTETEGRQSVSYLVYLKTGVSSPHFLTTVVAFGMGDTLDKGHLSTSVDFYFFVKFTFFKT